MYTITNQGTYLSISAELQNRTTIYKSATDAPNNPLLNGTHMLFGAGAKNEKMADSFAKLVLVRRDRRLLFGLRRTGSSFTSGHLLTRLRNFGAV